MKAAPQTRARHGSERGDAGPEDPIGVLARLGLAGRTAFYAILTALAVRIALLGGVSKREADANGALSLVSRPFIGKVAIAAVALGFVMFGVARLIGALQDQSVSLARRWMTGGQGLFYLLLAYVPCAFLAGNHQTGSQGQQQQTTARVFDLPGGRWLVLTLGVVVIAVCVGQIRAALHHEFRQGLQLEGASGLTRRLVDAAGVLGIGSRSLVFLPLGVLMIISAAEADPRKALGTDGEILRLAGHTWGQVALCFVCAGLAVFVIYSGIETRYRRVISAR